MKNIRMLSFDQWASCRALAIELVRQKAKLIASIEAKIVATKSHRGRAVFGRPS